MHYHLHCTALHAAHRRSLCPHHATYVSPSLFFCTTLHILHTSIALVLVSPAHCLETLSLILLSILCNASSSSASKVPDFLFACLFSSLRICALYWTPTTPSEKFLHILFVLVHFTTNTNHTPQSSCSQNQMTLAKLKGVTFSGTMIFYICLPFPT